MSEVVLDAYELAQTERFKKTAFATRGAGVPSSPPEKGGACQAKLGVAREAGKPIRPDREAVTGP